MLSENVYILRAHEYAELADKAQDFKAREILRHLAACWLRLADYAKEQRPSMCWQHAEGRAP